MEDYSSLLHCYMTYLELPGILCVILLLVSYLKNSFLPQNETNILYKEILMPDVININKIIILKNIRY